MTIKQFNYWYDALAEDLNLENAQLERLRKEQEAKK